jgi:4-diphosphocytidyl-2-C-methyl-D-erythritol kinase
MRRREDGFHDLASLFHVISLGDMLSFEDLSEQGEDELTCNWADVPTGPSNLVCKALALFRKHTGMQAAATCTTHAFIPLSLCCLRNLVCIT